VALAASGNNPHTRSLTKYAPFLLLAAFAVGCGGRVQLDGLRKSDAPVYWLGSSFEGLELTYADTWGGDGALLVYGSCEPSGGFLGDAGCTPPLQLRSCSGSDGVSLFGGQTLMRRAAKELRPLNAAAHRVGRPYIQFGHGSYCS